MHIISRLLLAVAAFALAIGALAACSDGNGKSGTYYGGLPIPVSTAGPLSGDLTVFAASSLTAALEQEKSAFEGAHPGVSITFNFAGSPTLVTQLGQGADADVLATADIENMHAAYKQELVVDEGKTFARNTLAVIVPKDNPGDITTPSDLRRDGLRIVIAQEGNPAGNYARQVLGKIEAGSAGSGFAADVLANVISNEPNVKAVVSKVQLGEADAGIVYVTDVTNEVAGDIEMIAIEDNVNVIAGYRVAVTANAKHADLARAFIQFLLAPGGQRVLTGEGFLSAQ